MDEENCVVRIWHMHCPHCGYDPLASAEAGTYIDAFKAPIECPKCGQKLIHDEDCKDLVKVVDIKPEINKKLFMVEMADRPIMGLGKEPCQCPVCLSGLHPMCLIASRQVEDLDHCPILQEVTNG